MKTRVRMRTVLVAGLVALVVGGLETLVLATRYVQRSHFLTQVTTGICERDGRVGDDPSPYGPITSCRVVDRDIHLFGGVDASIYLLLQTATGSAAIRIDYRDMQAGSHYNAEAHEVGAAQAPSLSSRTRQRLRQDIDVRGGVKTPAWVIHYGDG
jgi:hypothetical protein